MTSAAGRAEFNAYVNQNEGRANASYSLMVQSEAGVPPVKAISGMMLVANVNGTPPTPQSAIIFYADNFGLYTKDLAGVITSPFFVSKGTDGVSRVRMNIAHIQDHIQSDIYTPKTTGWIIRKDGSAEFNGTSSLARLYAGSILVDPIHGGTMASTATGMWRQTGTLNNGPTISQNNQSTAMIGPDGHASVGVYQRIRNTRGQYGNNVNLATTILFSGVADHFVTLWYQYSGQGWVWANTSVTPVGGYDGTTCGWSGVLPCDPGGYYEFGVSPTDRNFQGFPGSNNWDLRDFILSVTMVNM